MDIDVVVFAEEHGLFDELLQSIQPSSAPLKVDAVDHFDLLLYLVQNGGSAPSVFEKGLRQVAVDVVTEVEDLGTCPSRVVEHVEQVSFVVDIVLFEDFNSLPRFGVGLQVEVSERLCSAREEIWLASVTDDQVEKI